MGTWCRSHWIPPTLGQRSFPGHQQHHQHHQHHHHFHHHHRYEQYQCDTIFAEYSLIKFLTGWTVGQRHIFQGPSPPCLKKTTGEAGSDDAQELFDKPMLYTSSFFVPFLPNQSPKVPSDSESEHIKLKPSIIISSYSEIKVCAINFWKSWMDIN